MEDKEGQDIQNETPAPAIEAESPVVPPLENGTEEPAKPGRRMRRLLIWMVGLVIVLGAGVILTWTLRVQPQTERLAVLEAEAIAAKEQFDVLNAEVIELRPLVDENVRLTDELTSTRAHLVLLDVLVDVTTAQLALAQEDTIAAKAALEGTEQILSALEAILDDADAKKVGEMAGRLQLVLEEVGSDAFAAKNDLEILANNLLSMERELFGE